MRLDLALTLSGFLLFLPYSAILDGLERKIEARIQGRRGPPIAQTVYDLIKLFRKRVAAPVNAPPLCTLSPIMSLLMSLVALMMLPYSLPSPLGFPGDLILLICLIMASTMTLLYGGALSGNPYARVGCSRGVSLLTASGLMAALIVASIAIKYRTLSLSAVIQLFSPTPSSILVTIALSIYAYIEAARLPFDVSEAEPEIASGYLVEYGGSLLGFAMYARILKRSILYILLSALALGLIDDVVGLQGPARFALLVLLTTLLSTIYAIVSSVSGRFRVGHALYVARVVAIVPLTSLMLALMGL